MVECLFPPWHTGKGEASISHSFRLEQRCGKKAEQTQSGKGRWKRGQSSGPVQHPTDAGNLPPPAPLRSYLIVLSFSLHCCSSLKILCLSPVMTCQQRATTSVQSPTGLCLLGPLLRGCPASFYQSSCTSIPPSLVRS